MDKPKRPRGTKAGKKKKFQGAKGAGFSGNGRNMASSGRARSSPHPTLYAGVFGRVEPVESTLTVLDNLAPQSTGRYLVSPVGHGQRSMPQPVDIARDISPKIEAWSHLTQDGLAGDDLREAIGA